MGGIEILNSSSNTFLEKKFQIRTPRYESAAVAIGSKIIVMGGTLPNGQTTDLNEQFDTNTGSWKMFAVSLPRRLAGMQALAISKESIYVCGGSDGKTTK